MPAKELSNMKKIFVIVLLITFTGFIKAQESPKWHTNILEAVNLSEKTKKPLLLFFTGSDWCGWCIRLQKEVLKTPEFENWAKDKVILVELDFPKRTQQPMELKQQNAQLNAFFKVRGYPTLWFTYVTKTDEGKISFSPLGSTGYIAGGPDKWLEGANQIMNSKKQ